MNSRILYGAGSQGRVCMDIAASNGWQFNWVVDDHAKVQEIHGVQIIRRNDLPINVANDFEFVVAVGNNNIRKQFVSQMNKHGGKPINLIHPFSEYSHRASLGNGVVSMAGVIVNTDVIIGHYCVLNTSCSVDHDCILGDFVNICPGVHLAGGVQVGAGSFLGTGCVVNPNIKIGMGSVIGSGAVVTRDIPDFKVAYGNPARIQRPSR